MNTTQRKNQDIADWMRGSKPGQTSPMFAMEGRSQQGVRWLAAWPSEFRTDPDRAWTVWTGKANKRLRSSPIVAIISCVKRKKLRIKRGKKHD